VLSIVKWVLAQAEEHAEETNDPADLYPHWEELIVGAVAFGILFFFMWKWVLPRMNALLDERRDRIQGELEQAEETRRTAERELAEYREQLTGAREEANRIIEEARRAADQLRADLQAKAEQDAQATVARAQEEIRAERDRVFQELRGAVGQIAVEIAGRVVGQALDQNVHQQLIDEYIDEVSGNGRRTSGQRG
jgi:F-type H+-transporting ATPase subunit b